MDLRGYRWQQHGDNSKWGYYIMYLSGFDRFTKDNEKRDTKNPREEKSNKVFKKEGEDNA